MNRVLIVGGTGFLGFHFAKYCLKKKFKVFCLSRKKPNKKRFLRKVNYIFLDISSKNQVKQKLKLYSNIDYVINFGGEVEHKRLKKTFLSHFNGLKNLTNFYFKKSIKKFVQIGSGLEYGKARSPQKETFSINPDSNYALAKGKATQYLLKISKHKFPGIVIRPYQVYGPYQDYNRLIPIVIKNCLEDKKFPCSSGRQLRDFLYIDDFVEIVFKLMVYKDNNGQVYNIGYGKAFKVKKLINLIKRKINKGVPVFGKVKLRKEENLITYPSIYKVKKFFKWKPKVNLISGLNKTIEFYSKEVK